MKIFIQLGIESREEGQASINIVDGPTGALIHTLTPTAASHVIDVEPGHIVAIGQPTAAPAAPADPAAPTDPAAPDA